MNLAEWDQKNGRRILNARAHGVEEVGVVADLALNLQEVFQRGSVGR